MVFNESFTVVPAAMDFVRRLLSKRREKKLTEKQHRRQLQQRARACHLLHNMRGEKNRELN